eukprot:1602565-Amphidinium_carterae.1
MGHSLKGLGISEQEILSTSLVATAFDNSSEDESDDEVIDEQFNASWIQRLECNSEMDEIQLHNHTVDTEGAMISFSGMTVKKGHLD